MFALLGILGGVVSKFFSPRLPHRNPGQSVIFFTDVVLKLEKQTENNKSKYNNQCQKKTFMMKPLTSTQNITIVIGLSRCKHSANKKR